MTLEDLPYYSDFHQKVFNLISKPSSAAWHEIIGILDQLIRLLSIKYPRTQYYYRDFVLKFAYEETSIRQFQSDLAALLVHEPLLFQYFSGFLNADLSTSPRCDAARQYFCALAGIPMSMPKQPSYPSMSEVAAFNQSVQERFLDRPGHIRDLIQLTLRCWLEEISMTSSNRHGLSSSAHLARKQIFEVFEEEPDLLAFFKRLWPA